jgi:hypothetical protein
LRLTAPLEAAVCGQLFGAVYAAKQAVRQHKALNLLNFNISGGEMLKNTETFHSHYNCLKHVQIISRKAGLLKNI